MKANEILANVMFELQYYNKDKMKISKILSSILLYIGLKKKRMADGIYYYGIVHKDTYLSQGNIEEMFKKTVEEHKLESTREILKNHKFSSNCKSKLLRSEPELPRQGVAAVDGVERKSD